MDEIKFQWYVEMYGEGFGYVNHIRWNEPLDLTGSGADATYYGKGFQQDAPSVNEEWIWKIPQKKLMPIQILLKQNKTSFNMY
jgi:hypothetical protein